MSKYVANLIAQGADPVLIAKLGGQPVAAGPDGTADDPAPSPSPVKRTARKKR